MQVDGVSYNMKNEGKDMKYLNCDDQRENIILSNAMFMNKWQTYNISINKWIIE